MDQDSSDGELKGGAMPYAPVIGAGTSSVSPDEIAKIRLWHLLAQSQLIFRQTIFADTKAATLLALIGLLAARVALSIPLDAVDFFVGIVFFNKAVLLAACFLVIMPRYPSRKDWAGYAGRERFSWAGLANPYVEQDDYGAFGRDADCDAICTSIARSNETAAEVLGQKFWVLRVAFQLAVLDAILTMAVFLTHIPVT